MFPFYTAQLVIILVDGEAKAENLWIDQWDNSNNIDDSQGDQSALII